MLNAAKLILRLLHDPPPPPRIVVGNAFETYVAPVAARTLPRRLIEWGQRLMYGLRRD